METKVFDETGNLINLNRMSGELNRAIGFIKYTTYSSKSTPAMKAFLECCIAFSNTIHSLNQNGRVAPADVTKCKQLFEEDLVQSAPRQLKSSHHPQAEMVTEAFEYMSQFYKYLSN